MKKRLGFLGILFGIPAFGLIAGVILADQYDREFVSAVLRSPAAIANHVTREMIAPLGRVCGAADRSANLSGICGSYFAAVALEWAGIAAAAGAVLLLGGIAAAARLGRGNRELLSKIFRPGIRIVLIALFGLVLVQGAVAATGAYLLESELAHRTHVMLIGGIAIGTLIGASRILKTGFALSKPLQTSALAVAVPRDRQPRLWDFVEEVAERVGARPPRHVVVGLNPTFYATAARVRLLGSAETLDGETMYLSLPLLRLLDKEELGAVIGHELGHFHGADTAYTLRFVPVYRCLTEAMNSVGSIGGAQAIALAPALATLRFCLFAFSAAEREIGRQREIEADRIGAQAFGPQPLVTSLIKCAATGHLWNTLERAVVDALNAGRALSNLSQAFDEEARRGLEGSEEATMLKALAETAQAHPTDTHPTLAERSAKLGVPLVAGRGLMAAAKAPAAGLIDELEALETELTEHQHRMFLALGYAKLPENKPAEESAGE